MARRLANDGELLTTGQAARLLGSSRQHVVDLCHRGDLAFTSIGTHRRLRRADVAHLANSSGTDSFAGLTRDQRRSLWLHRAIAGRIAADPGRAFEQARQNLKIMEAAHPRGPTAARLNTWRALLNGPVEDVLDVLCSPSPEAAELRQSTPFAGVLDDAERGAVLSAFRSASRRRR